MNPDSSQPRCDFCGKSSAEVTRLIEGANACICDVCVRSCQTILDEPAPAVAKSPRVPPAIYLEEYWRQRGLPPLPIGEPPADFSPEQSENLRRVTEIVGMFSLHPAGHWNERSVNARAQHRWPSAKIIIEDIEAIRLNWFHFGLPGLAEMVRQGRSPHYNDGRVAYHHVLHDVKTMTAVEVPASPGTPLFITTGCLTTLEFHPEFSAHIYVVGLESQYGRYRFNLVNYEPPAPPEASGFCLLTKVD